MSRSWLLALTVGCTPVLTSPVGSEPESPTEDAPEPPVDITLYAAECPVDLGTPGAVAIREACTPTAPAEVIDPWDVTIEFRYMGGSLGVQMTPAVGDITGDGAPEIVFTTLGSGQLVALDGASSFEVLYDVGGYDGGSGVALVDRDEDGVAEVFAYDGSTIPLLADLDADGDAELILGDAIGNGERTFDLAGKRRFYGAPTAADLDLDGQQELLVGGGAYDARGNELWTNPEVTRGAYPHAAAANVDGDPEHEVFVVEMETVWLHEPDGTVITSFPLPGGTYPGPPCVADFDGDGAVELGVHYGSRFSVFEADGSELWSAALESEAFMGGGCSGFDFDRDGAYEILFADATAFRIYDGATGTVRYENRDHSAETRWQYPVVADVDGDGSAEIVVADNGDKWRGITIYGHAGNGWPRSGPTWPTEDFDGVDIEPDGGVPRWPAPVDRVRARPPEDDATRPDLLVAITDVCVATCAYGAVTVGVQVTNQGAADVHAGVPLSVYADDGRPSLLTTVSLPEVPAGTTIAGIEIELATWDVAPSGFLLGVDDDGAGGQDADECDETNNTVAYAGGFCP